MEKTANKASAMSVRGSSSHYTLSFLMRLYMETKTICSEKACIIDPNVQDGDV
jgi:hypothetical protein